MNERIRKLAEQAGLKVESFMTNPPKPFQILGSTEQFEKFAQLIVQECIYKVNEDTTPDSGYTYEPWKLLKHFGVGYTSRGNFWNKSEKNDVDV